LKTLRREGRKTNLVKPGDLLEYFEITDSLHYYRFHYIPNAQEPAKEYFRFNFEEGKGFHYHRKTSKMEREEEGETDEVTLEEAIKRITEAMGKVDRIKEKG